MSPCLCQGKPQAQTLKANVNTERQWKMARYHTNGIQPDVQMWCGGGGEEAWDGVQQIIKLLRFSNIKKTPSKTGAKAEMPV